MYKGAINSHGLNFETTFYIYQTDHKANNHTQRKKSTDQGSTFFNVEADGIGNVRQEHKCTSNAVDTVWLGFLRAIYFVTL